MTSPEPTPIVASIPPTTPFVGPEAIERQIGRKLNLRLGANESLFGASPKAIAAMKEKVEWGHFYGDPEAFDLRTAIAEEHEAGIQNVVLASGIDELLMLFARCFIAPGEPVVTTLGSYPTFEYAVNSVGGRLERVPYRDNRVDLEALLAKTKETRAKVLYLANPDNPSSTWQGVEAIRHFIDQIPAGVLLLLDEAYYDFAPSGDPFDPTNPQVVRFRTFSKAHGMAGMRVGYALAHSDHVVTLNKVRMHFGVSGVAQAGALAALQDTEFVKSVIAQTRATRSWLSGKMAESGFDSLDSETNFLVTDLGSEPRATGVLMKLREHGVFIRKPMVAPLDRFIRVTIGRREDTERFFEIFQGLLQTV